MYSYPTCSLLTFLITVHFATFLFLFSWLRITCRYKQRGKEAIAANNVFFYITYEGTIDVDKISDPVCIFTLLNWLCLS